MYKKFDNAIALYMGRGPQELGTIKNGRGYYYTEEHYLRYDNVYGVGLSQRLSNRLHLEMLGFSNDTFLSGFKIDF
jgi:hypothetical protein